jgi:hypothetical protein
MIENKVRGKSCSSGIGEERIKQMEAAKALLEKAKEKGNGGLSVLGAGKAKYGKGGVNGFGTGAIGAVDSMFV